MTIERTWYRIALPTGQAMYGYGTDKDAHEYARRISGTEPGTVYCVEDVTDPQQYDRLEAGDEGVELDGAENTACPNCGDDMDAGHAAECDETCAARDYTGAYAWENEHAGCTSRRTHGVVCADHRKSHCADCGIADSDSNALLSNGDGTYTCHDCAHESRHDHLEGV